ncbi:MAG: prenyltransferase [Conexivisphaerales archaeon]
MNIIPWLKETFEPTLLMSVLLVSLGGAAAWFKGDLNIPLLLIAMVGAVLIQSSVNLLNDYYDFVRGVDYMTEKTPFSGGSKYLVEGLISPKGVYIYGICSLCAASLIGIYFSLTRNILLFPIVIEAILSTYFYTTILARWYLGEFFAGLNLGPLAVLGAYIVASGSTGMFPIVVSIAPGLMIGNILLMNEIPDMETDFKASRRNLVTLLGKKHAAWLTFVIGISAYAWIAFSITMYLLPLECALAFISLPLFISGAILCIRNFSSTKKMIPALGLNVISALMTITILIISLVIAK